MPKVNILIHRARSNKNNMIQARQIVKLFLLQERKKERKAG